MKINCVFGLVIFLLACSHVSQKHESTTVNQIEPRSIDSIVLIKFDNNICVHWNNSSGQMVDDDSLFKNLKQRYKNIRNYLVDQITDTIITPAKVCNKDKLTLGDAAFAIVDEMDKLPYFEITHIQSDVYDYGCPYAYGHFSVIDKNRGRIKGEVKRYLLSKHKLLNR